MSETHGPIIDRKELKKADTFVKQSSAIFHWAQDNVRVVLIAVGVLFLVIVSASIFKNYRADQTLKAAGELYGVKKKLENKLTSLGKTPAAANWEKETRAELDQLNALYDKHKNTVVGYESALILAQIYHSKDIENTAAQYYVKAADSAPNKSFKSSAQYSLAFSYETLQKYDEAISILKNLTQDKELPYRADALLSLARNYSLKNDKAKSLETYNLVLQDFPASAFSKTAEAQKNLLNSGK